MARQIPTSYGFRIEDGEKELPTSLGFFTEQQPSTTIISRSVADGLLFFDTATAAALRLRAALDGLLIGDDRATALIKLRGAVDGLLLSDDVALLALHTHILTLTDNLALLDDTTLSIIRADATALVFARLGARDFLSIGVGHEMPRRNITHKDT